MHAVFENSMHYMDSCMIHVCIICLCFLHLYIMFLSYALIYLIFQLLWLLILIEQLLCLYISTMYAFNGFTMHSWCILGTCCHQHLPSSRIHQLNHFVPENVCERKTIFITRKQCINHQIFQLLFHNIEMYNQ